MTAFSSTLHKHTHTEHRTDRHTTHIQTDTSISIWINFMIWGLFGVYFLYLLKTQSIQKRKTDKFQNFLKIQLKKKKKLPKTTTSTNYIQLQVNWEAERKEPRYCCIFFNQRCKGKFSVRKISRIKENCQKEKKATKSLNFIRIRILLSTFALNYKQTNKKQKKIKKITTRNPLLYRRYICVFYSFSSFFFLNFLYIQYKKQRQY